MSVPIITIMDVLDPTAGSGLLAAVKTVSSLGGFADAVATGIAVQTPDKVKHITAHDKQMVKDQLDAVLETYTPQVLLLGLLPDKSIIELVSDYLDEAHNDDLFVVIDPVMINHSGHQYLKAKDIDAIKKRLLVHADILTPNIFEAEQLTGITIETRDHAEQAAEMLMTFGCRSIYIKEESRKDGQIFDLFLDYDNFYIVETPHFKTKRVQGAGTTLAAAIAVSIASGMPLTNAVSGARGYLAQAIQNAPLLRDEDKFGPVEHFN
jgi:hydroxymethylpyrimidine/phosphomethylpyrimidine kinase